MNWVRDLIERMVGLNPTIINPALPHIGKMLADLKAMEPATKKLEAIYFDEIAPILKTMRPVAEDAVKEWDQVAPAVESALEVFGIHLNMGHTHDQAVTALRQAITAARPEIDMHWIQTALQARGYDLEADGKYGEATRAAVEQYQKSKGLKVDGWAGKETIDALHGDVG
jgi:murein L,D-transpeptidase YcbB/YkuD